ncbi:MAG TPA: DUF4097 family beta strand repeat-containing protein [Pyrinomonadaceae bacterium]|jgi:hypothetical protein
MKRNALLLIIAVVVLICSATASSAQKKDKDKLKDRDFEQGEQMERTIPASQNVVLSVCMASGEIQVHGWDRPEVKVTATNVRQLELQGGGLNPSQRVEVLASNRSRTAIEEPLAADCHASSDLEINVPRGATVVVKLRNGNIEVSQVAVARIENTSGDISISKVTNGVEAVTISGDLDLTDSGGRVRLRTVGGDIDATNIKSVEPGDDFNASSTGGDIDIVAVSLSSVSASTTSGMITLTGQLARRGKYELNTFSGDIELNISQDSAFRINARAPQGSITTDFAIKSANDTDSQNLLESGILTGTYGSGDWASLTVHSFSGGVRLQKR